MGFVKLHEPCHACGSSDAVSVNDDGSAKCFSCGKFFKNYAEPTSAIDTEDTFVPEGDTDYYALTDRGISKEVAQKYGVKVTLDDNGKIKQHHYPYYNQHELVATKTRYVKDKNFFSTGSFHGAGLFGENLFKAGKRILITEGECDAMAAHQLLGMKWEAVSIRTGTQGAVNDVKNSLEFLDKFEEVIICFDNDKHGKEASSKVAQLFKPGKAKIMCIPEGFKDANDMLRQNEIRQFTKAYWDAKTYTPTGVINVSEKSAEYKKREKKKSVPYPYEGLNEKLYGLRQGELVTLTGGTGLGKSSVTRELEHHLIKSTNDNIGVIALEEDWRRTIDGILSIEANARLYIDQVREQFTEEEIDKFFEILYDGENKNRVWIHAHFGTNDIEEIFSKLRFMIISCDCKWVVIDHLHMLVTAVTEGDERRAIDNIMTRLRSIVEETGAGVILVSHLRRTSSDKGHENGIEVSLSHLRGSQSIAQLSDCVIALERNQQADDAQEANTTRLRVLKSRYTGDVGVACYLKYNGETGRLYEYEQEEDDF